MDSARQPTDVLPIRLRLFGEFELVREGQPLRLPTRKTELLLAYLALAPGPHGREKLAALLWGDTPDEQARGSLRKALTALRRALGPDAILADRQAVRLNPDYPLWVDVRAFERPAADRPPFPLSDAEPADESLAALDLYRGELLSGYYDDWIMPLREHYHAAYLEQTLALCQAMRTRSDYRRAIVLAHRALDADPANERAHQHLMFCYLAAGRRSEALQQYETARRLLWEELAVEPGPETTALYRWIQRGPGARPASEALITNLPIPLSSFIGRANETARIKRLLTAGDAPLSPAGQATPPVRLITLTGPGGSGKTRLAIQAATDLMDAFPDGVWWVELAALNDDAHVPPAVARALGVPESPDEPLLTTLVAALRARRLLVLLDNCEHLISACAALAQTLLDGCPHLQIVATSRQALGLIGEIALPVPPLAVPRYARWPLLGAMLNFEGIRLFVERAGAVNPGFALTDENAQAVRQVCARLDGIPLAIELAAMWMKTLSIEELAARLDDRFDLLHLGSRTAPPRHQTLRGVLDWSYNLLAEPERALLRRLSVFAGGGTVEAVRSLYDDAPDGPSPSALLDLLNRLVDKSLLIAEQARGRTRFQMLETIREYGREKLRAAGESDGVRGRHLDWFVRLAEEAEVGLRGTEQIEWLERLDAELDNLRAALEWSLTRDVERGLRLAGALTWYWNLRGHWSEGPAWLSRLLAAPLLARSPGFAAARAKALTAAASLAFWGSNDYTTARRWLEEAIALYRAGSPADRWGLGDALALYGEVLRQLGEPAAARTALEESLAIGESLGEEGRWISAWVWVGLADIADAPVERQVGLERSADLFRTLGDRAQLPVVLARLAWFHLSQGAYAAAEAYARESVVLTDQMGDIMGAAWMLKLNGDLALAQSDYAQAAAHYRAALERFRILGTKVGIANALYALGEVHLAEGRDGDARAMWTEALALYTELESAKARQYLLERLERLEGKPG